MVGESCFERRWVVATRTAMRGRTLAGFSVVEYNLIADANDMTAATVGRLVCHVLRYLARQGG